MLRRGGILKTGPAASIAVALFMPATAQAVILRPGDVLVAHNGTPAAIGKINPRNGNEVAVSSGGELTEPWS